tara:strand:+ start:397 stop:600 length:204 start_codon:yes stop_codon:yes gene_type:complete
MGYTIHLKTGQLTVFSTVVDFLGFEDLKQFQNVFLEQWKGFPTSKEKAQTGRVWAGWKILFGTSARG